MKNIFKKGLIENEELRGWLGVILFFIIVIAFVVALKSCSDPSQEVQPEIKIEKPERGITIDTSKKN